LNDGGKERVERVLLFFLVNCHRDKNGGRKKSNWQKRGVQFASGGGNSVGRKKKQRAPHVDKKPVIPIAQEREEPALMEREPIKTGEKERGSKGKGRGGISHTNSYLKTPSDVISKKDRKGRGGLEVW